MWNFSGSIHVCRRGYHWAASDEDCFPRLLWSVPNPVSSADNAAAHLRLMPGRTPEDRYELSPEDYVAYDPFKKQPLLFLVFAETPATAEGLLAFAKNFGSLWNAFSEGMTLYEWKCVRADMEAAVDLWQGIEQKNSERLRRHVTWRRDKAVICSPLLPRHRFDGAMEEHPRPPFHPRENYRTGDLVAPARDLLDWVISTRPASQIELQPLRLPSKALTFSLEVNTLLNALWIQFAIAVSGGSEIRRCETCGKPFQPKRTDQVFCSDTCRVSAYRKRRTKAVEMRQAGSSVEAIAKETGSSVEQVKDWLRKENGNGKKSTRAR